ncbi:hypothetical protein [Actinophytocola xanthii]|uniref:Uncharacterized protein n=1 Tax=Actinophytocola xanthii TaxID=1912961 RepID=A0A1Q8CDY9_9PSEU|nr:hypothetical protein [Actinophytocola xanthii]OLF12552.1 hypothetical protein BU204_29035 [Actinophytocola xanthii]
MLQLTDGTPEGPGDQRSPGPRARFTFAVATLLASAAATAALLVSGDAARRPDPSRATGVPPVFALYEHDLPGQRRIAVANDRLVTECMARAGLAYESATARAGGELAEPDPQQPFGPESIEQLAPVTEPAPPQEVARNDDYLHALYGPPDRRVAVRGARLRVSGPAHGCVAEAAARLLGADRPRWMLLKVLLFEAAEDARHDVESDEELRAATRRWRACMGAAGFRAEDPVELFDGLSATGDLREVPELRADVRCKRETGYLEVAYARLALAQQRRLDADPSVAADWLRLVNHQKNVANEVLAADRR